MPTLDNQRWERFAQALAQGKTGDDAYQEAGYKPNRHNASRLKTTETILRRVAELHERSAIRTITTVDDIARQLDEDRAFAISNKQSAAAVSATLGKAKVLGLITDKSESNVTINDTAQREAESFKGRVAGLTPRPGQTDRKLDG